MTTAAPATTTTDATQSGASAAPGASGAPAEWTSGLAQEDLGYVQNKGWRGPADAVESYRNLEKLRGVPAERLLTLPETDDVAGWGPIYDRLGRPKDASGYQIEAPEGQSDAFAKAAAAQMHTLGLTKTQGDALGKWWNGELAAIAQRMVDERSTANKQEAEGLTREWGAAHAKNLQVAQRAAAVFGADADTISAMEAQIGFAKTMKFFHSIGARLGEADFVDGQADTLGAMTPEAAKAELAQLKADKAWVDRYLSGGKEERARFQKLIAWANPGA